MKRREFLSASLAVGAAAAGAATTVSAQPGKSKQMFYEFSKYTVVNNAHKRQFESFWEQAVIPALNRMDIQPVGLLKSKFGTRGLDYYAIIPHQTIDSFLTAWDVLAADTEYQQAAAEFDSSMNDPIYDRIQTSLFRAFSHLPELHIPDHLKGNRDRFFELRIYESHNRDKARLKVEMFNEGGEIALFQETGLNPMMFGEALAGENLPNLTYMLGFASMEERDKAWATFVASPKWKEMSGLPRYKDTVSAITDVILTPASCSQI